MEEILRPNMTKVSLLNIFWLVFFVLIFAVIGFLSIMNINVLNIIGYLMLIPIFIFLFIFIIIIGNAKNTRYIIKDNSILSETLFISDNRTVLPISQITNVDYTISWLFDKIFKTGTIQIYTAGSDSADIQIKNIANVEQVYDKINNLLDLNESIKLNKNGAYYGTHQDIEKSELLKRIKPDAGAATIIFTLQIFPFAILTLFLPSILIYKVYKKKYYDFYNNKLEYYDGFLSIHKATVPLDRITNIDENRGLLDQMFGVSSIKIETAGSGGAEIIINSVKNGNQIIKHLKEVLREHGRN